MEQSLELRPIQEISPKDVRNYILDVEEKMINHPMSLNGAELKAAVPTSHRFCDGMYIRECEIKAGLAVVGMIHRHEHPVFLMKGSARVLTESGGVEDLIAPYYGVSPALTKRLVIALEDTVWVTTHLNPDNCKNVAELEKRLVAEKYEDIEGES